MLSSDPLAIESPCRRFVRRVMRGKPYVRRIILLILYPNHPTSEAPPHFCRAGQSKSVSLTHAPLQILYLFGRNFPQKQISELTRSLYPHLSARAAEVPCLRVTLYEGIREHWACQETLLFLQINRTWLVAFWPGLEPQWLPL